MKLISSESAPCSGGWPILVVKKYDLGDNREGIISYYKGSRRGGDVNPLCYVAVKQGKETLFYKDSDPRFAETDLENWFYENPSSSEIIDTD